MAANTQPIYTLTPNVDFTAALTTGNVTKNGTAGTSLAFTAGADGSFVQKLILKPLGTNVASALRVFLNNNNDPTNAVNNTYIADVGLPATTLTEIAGQPVVEVPINMAIDPLFRIYVVLATTVASGWQCTTVAGNY